MNEVFFLSFMLKEGIIDTFKFKSLILIKKKVIILVLLKTLTI